MTKEQKDVIDKMARIACGGNIPETPEYYNRLEAAGDAV
jgi:hypothetical protein